LLLQDGGVDRLSRLLALRRAERRVLLLELLFLPPQHGDVVAIAARLRLLGLGLRLGLLAFLLRLLAFRLRLLALLGGRPALDRML
jgi:hypothetical protein